MKEKEILEKKEKEKNKELEDIDLTAVYINGFYDGEKKWKDRIKNKINEIEHSPYWADCGDDYDHDIQLLEEILKENTDE